jgi:hypothetical protein
MHASPVKAVEGPLDVHYRRLELDQILGMIQRRATKRGRSPR